MGIIKSLFEGFMNKFKCCCLIAVIAVSNSLAVEFHVATDGNDTNPGTSAKPFGTLKGARDAIRGIKTAGQTKEPITVFVHQGVYTLAAPLTLTAEDSGSAAAPIVYRGYADEKPVLQGGRPITGWTTYKGNILKADVGAQGLKGIRFRTL
ncbi:MAG TPA: hypothetical protein VIJ25_20185, partial [Methylococcales bacterium]